MKKIKILKTTIATPSSGKILSYKAGDEYVVDNRKMTPTLYAWFLRNKLATEVEDAIIEVKKIEKSPENKMIKRSPKNKAIAKSSVKKELIL